jgi:hypothetical protein
MPQRATGAGQRRRSERGPRRRRSVPDGDLQRSLESTRDGLAKLLGSLRQSGFDEAAPAYREMQLVLLNQRLWSRRHGRDDLDPLWTAIADTARAVHEILAEFDAVMERLVELDRIELAPNGAAPLPADAGVALARLLAEGTAVSGATLRDRLAWSPEERRRRLAHLCSEGVLERRGWGRGLSYRLSDPARRRLERELAGLFPSPAEGSDRALNPGAG